MKYTTVYVGMDVHKESFTLACYTNEKEEAEYVQRTEAHYSKVISYLEAMRFHYGDEVTFICGYEAGCLGSTDEPPCAVRNNRTDIHAGSARKEEGKDRPERCLQDCQMFSTP